MMGAGGVTNRCVQIVNGRTGDLPIKSIKPNSRYDLYVDGIRVQSRWFDYEKKVVRNRDYVHQDAHNNHKFPHDHNWIWKCETAYRNKENLEPDFDKYN